MSAEVWVLGGTGRTGREITRRLTTAGAEVALVGRDAARLRSAVDEVGAARSIVAADIAAMAEAIAAERPAVVVNTVGPFLRTAEPIARACLPHSSYLDLANDFVAATAVLGLHEEAVAAGRTVVSGAGFGVLATEAPAWAVCRDRPVPARLLVESVPSLATEEGLLGEALSRTIVEAVPHRGRRFRAGRLVPAPVGGGAHPVLLPDGGAATASTWPSGDLIAAQRISGAPDVVAASSEVPAGALVRMVVPVAGLALRVPVLRRLAVDRVARIRLTSKPAPRPHSWGHAIAVWADGSRREAWLRMGDANEFTAATAAAVALRIASGAARSGAGFPLGTCGDSLLGATGAELV